MNIIPDQFRKLDPETAAACEEIFHANHPLWDQVSNYRHLHNRERRLLQIARLEKTFGNQPDVFKFINWIWNEQTIVPTIEDNLSAIRQTQKTMSTPLHHFSESFGAHAETHPDEEIRDHFRPLACYIQVHNKLADFICQKNKPAIDVLEDYLELQLRIGNLAVKTKKLLENKHPSQLPWITALESILKIIGQIRGFDPTWNECIQLEGLRLPRYPLTNHDLRTLASQLAILCAQGTIASDIINKIGPESDAMLLQDGSLKIAPEIKTEIERLDRRISQSFAESLTLAFLKKLLDPKNTPYANLRTGLCYLYTSIHEAREIYEPYNTFGFISGCQILRRQNLYHLITFNINNGGEIPLWTAHLATLAITHDGDRSKLNLPPESTLAKIHLHAIANECQRLGYERLARKLIDQNKSTA